MKSKRIMKNKRKTRTRAWLKALHRRYYFMFKKRVINPEKEARCYPRKLARSVAKANMERRGYRKINRLFSVRWRRFV